MNRVQTKVEVFSGRMSAGTELLERVNGFGRGLPEVVNRKSSLLAFQAVMSVPHLAKHTVNGRVPYFICRKCGSKGKKKDGTMYREENHHQKALEP